MTVAALFVERDGVYYGLDGVDPWDEERDARLYEGPYPVVAHPPCARWGGYWDGGPTRPSTHQLGADSGCFGAALTAVRNNGGVLEHPAQSRAWRWFGLLTPPKGGGWVRADGFGGWTCEVEQGHYGHRAHKPTWLYAVTPEPPSLRWGTVKSELRDCRNLCRAQRRATPVPFRDVLLSMARSVGCGERLVVG